MQAATATETRKFAVYLALQRTSNTQMRLLYIVPAVSVGGIVVVIAAATHFAFAAARAGEPSMLVWMGGPTVALAVFGAVRAYYDGVFKDWMAMRAGDFTRGFVGAAVLFGAAWVFTKVVAPVGSAREPWLARVYLQLGDPSMLRKNAPVLVGAIIVMAIAEEILWRGFVTTLLAEKIGSRRAWVWAAVLYAIAHAPTAFALQDRVAGYNPTVMAAALGGGLVWGFLARRYGRLLPGVISHILFDWTVLMMFRLWGPSI
ncbi:MAG: CPBP family intramembrane metalloprotease [Polyangiaceae bacterium]|nr:CPBP family intramembrane metalloprotease [Polyangiaceae bacterium]